MNRLKDLRKEKGLSQKAFSEEIGVSYRTIQNWENGESQIKPDKAQQLADYFGVSVGYLLGYSEEANFYEAIHETIAKELLVAFIEFLLGNGICLSDSQIKAFLNLLEATGELNRQSSMVKSEFLIYSHYTGEKILDRFDELYILKQYDLIEQILDGKHLHPLAHSLMTQKDQPKDKE